MKEKESQAFAPSGIVGVPSISWGSHLGHLFTGADELRDLLVPYFAAGLANNERCLWVADDPFRAHEARAALRVLVPDLDEREGKGQIEIQDTDAFYDRAQPLDPDAIVKGLARREGEAREAGYRGLRTNGNCAWVRREHWDGFLAYEAGVQEAVERRNLICMCSYRHGTLEPDILDGVIENHHLVLRKPRLEAARRTAEGEGAIASPGSPAISPDKDFSADVAAIQAISAVPTILDVVSRTTGMGFAAIARVTPERWVCLAVQDGIGFGLKPGGELRVDTTLCHEVRQSRDAIVIDHVAEDEAFCSHTRQEFMASRATSRCRYSSTTAVSGALSVRSTRNPPSSRTRWSWACSGCSPT